MRTFLSKFLILLGILSLLTSAFLYWQRTSPKRLSFDLGTEQIENLEAGSDKGGIEPVVLVIKDLNLELLIFESHIGKNGWEATSKGVSYLASSPVPGNPGNSILYGHNWKNLLGNITRLKPGQKIRIIYSDGTPKEFEIYYTQVVTPEDTQILTQSDDARITLYTCTGFLDSKRFVVTALLRT